jgi:hypothetical protein
MVSAAKDKTGACPALPDSNADSTAIVEQVRDGTQLRVRLLLDDQQHQFVNLVSLLDYAKR